MVILALKASGPCLLLDVLVLPPQCNWDGREFFGAFLFGVGNLFPLFLFFSFFRFLFLAWYEERKLRVTGTRTFTRTRWTQGVSCYASTFAAFDDFLLFLFFSPFYVCASSAAFWLKRAIWGIAA